MNEQWKTWWGPQWVVGDIGITKFKGKQTRCKIKSKHDPWDFRGWWYVDLLADDGLSRGVITRKGSDIGELAICSAA